MDYYSDYTRVVCAMIQYGDDILLKRRVKPPFKGMLCMPGGKIKKNETPRKAIDREVFEETGLITKEVYPAGLFIEIVHENTDTYRNLIFACFVEPTNFDYIQSTDEGENIALKYYEITNPKNRIRNEVAPWDLMFIDGADTRRSEMFNKIFEIQKSGSTYLVLHEEPI